MYPKCELIVECTIHGRMKRIDVCAWWICLGFDGEGCDTLVTDEVIARFWPDPPNMVMEGMPRLPDDPPDKPYGPWRVTKQVSFVE